MQHPIEVFGAAAHQSGMPRPYAVSRTNAATASTTTKRRQRGTDECRLALVRLTSSGCWLTLVPLHSP